MAGFNGACVRGLLLHIGEEGKRGGEDGNQRRTRDPIPLTTDGGLAARRDVRALQWGQRRGLERLPRAPGFRLLKLMSTQELGWSPTLLVPKTGTLSPPRMCLDPLEVGLERQC